MNVYKKINIIEVHWKMQFLGGGGGGGQKKKQDIVGLPKRGGLRQFADLRGSCWKRQSAVFEGGLILQCTLCVVSMVDTFQSGRLVTLCHMLYIQTAHVLNVTSNLVAGFWVFSGNIISSIPPPKKCIHHFFLVYSIHL